MVHQCDVFGCVFFFKQKTAYEMRISDWSSDVCSSDLLHFTPLPNLRRIVESGLLSRDHVQEQGGIRTHGNVAATAVFKTAALNHSAKIGRASCRERVCQYV